MTITIEPAVGETNALWHFIEPSLPVQLHNPDNVVLETGGFRLQWKKGPVTLDANIVLKAESG